MPKTRIVVAEDHQVVREGFRALLETQPDFGVVGEADNGLEVPGVVDHLRPDVLLLDLMLPGLNGMEVIRQVRQGSPATRVLILSMHANESYVLEALRSGAAGYLLKTASSSEMIAAVRAVVAGKRYLSPPLSDRVIEAYAQQARPAADIYETLTSRERVVLQLVAEGHKNTEIASRLCISVRTVESHRANLMRKLNLQSHADLVRYAIRRGLLPSE
jgi:DNA-binding NarL/FixJ family response regulator